MPYLTNKEVQIISFLIKDGIKAFDFRGGFRDCWFTLKESNELANKIEKLSDVILERDRDEFWYENEDNDRIHHLKILPEYFEAVVSCDKCFEIRKNDRNYQKGDILRLNEYQDGQYTGDVHVAEITYITDYAQQDGYVVLGIK
ncbi:ASCH/PUA domain-containing protein [Enterococcus faecalis]|uniref:ASCH/PUA domain-containing protein n=1 Tax=Enterococcus faecalis TaxID=1351 RepID=UPI0022E17A21|nr:ASCH/PUA domain-containing protein [Enterococcus faecalis]